MSRYTTPKVQKYNIMSSNDINTLIEKVNFAITEGWLPAGGVAVEPYFDVDKNENSFNYIQGLTYTSSPQWINTGPG